MPKKPRGRPTGGKNVKCLICYLQLHDPEMYTILHQEEAGYAIKASQIQERHKSWDIKRATVRAHIDNNHETKYLMQADDIRVSRRDIYDHLKRIGMQQLVDSNERVPPALLLQIAKAEMEEEKLIIQTQQFGQKIGLMSELMMGAMYGKEQLPAGKPIIEQDGKEANKPDREPAKSS